MKQESGNISPDQDDKNAGPGWSFLTNHAQVLVCIAADPEVRLRDIAATVGITERAAHRIVSDLAAAEYIDRRRNGRRNVYSINDDQPLPDALLREQRIGELLAVLAGRDERAATAVAR